MYIHDSKFYINNVDIYVNSIRFKICGGIFDRYYIYKRNKLVRSDIKTNIELFFRNDIIRMNEFVKK